MTIAEQYKLELATRTEEQETVSPLWEQPRYSYVDFLQPAEANVGELTLRFADGSVYDYESGDVYTEEEWKKTIAEIDEMVRTAKASQ